MVTVTEAPGSKPRIVGGHRKRRCRCAITVFAVRPGRPESQTGGSRRASSRFVTRAPRAALGDGLSQRCVCYREGGQDRSGRWRIYAGRTRAKPALRLQRPFVQGAGHDCRRYVVTVTKDRWSTTALPMEMWCEGRLSQPCEGKDDRIVEITRARHGPGGQTPRAAVCATTCPWLVPGLPALRPVVRRIDEFANFRIADRTGAQRLERFIGCNQKLIFHREEICVPARQGRTAPSYGITTADGTRLRRTSRFVVAWSISDHM